MCPKKEKDARKSTSLPVVAVSEVVTKTHNTSVNVNRTSRSNREPVYLQVLAAFLANDGHRVKVTVLFDSGSELSFIRSEAVRKGKLQSLGSSRMVTTGFQGLRSENVYNRIAFCLEDLEGGNRIPIEAFESTTLARYQLKQCTKVLALMSDANIPICGVREAVSREINIIIGTNFINKLQTGRSIQLAHNLITIETKIGWLVSGTLTEEVGELESKQVSVCVAQVESSNDCYEKLHQFWSLESIGVKAVETVAQFDEEEFVSQIEYDGRYTVPLPWIMELRDKLESNYGVAKARLDGLLRQIKRNQPEERYEKAIRMYDQEGHAVKVEKDEQTASYYMPHRAVISEMRSTKTRVVFDASSHAEGQLCLNDCLHSGTDRTLDVVRHLLRFRVGDYVFTADIQKAFLQIQIKQQDQAYLKYLWIKDIDSITRVVETWKMTRVVFRLTCYPYLLKVTLHQHAERIANKYPEVKKILKHQIYVDYLFYTSDDIRQIYEIEEQVQKALLEASMVVHKGTKSLQLSPEGPNNIVSILGLQWNHFNDVLTLPVAVEKIAAKVKLTKRALCSKISSIFDPLGLLAPLTAMVKVVFQATWTTVPRIDWDEEVNDEIKEMWESCVKLLRLVGTISIPRKLASLHSTTDIYHLHTFCDASPQVYRAVVYLVVIRATTTSRIVFSKFRLAPVKKLTLLRLELMAALVGVRITNYVTDNLPLEIKEKWFWTDSMIVLGWVNFKKFQKNSFINNRILEIKNLTSVEQWKHCQSEENPADLATKLKSALKLSEESIWWRGPEWLEKDMVEWSTSELQRNDFEEDKSTIGTVAMSDDKRFGIGEIIIVENFSSKLKLLRVTARVIEAVQKFKKKSSNFFNSIEEAENSWIIYEQKKYFTMKENELRFPHFQIYRDEKDRLRLRSRLEDSTFSDLVVRPILLPTKSSFTGLVLRDIQERDLHCGLNTMIMIARWKFWVPKIRPICKKIISLCTKCRRYTTKQWVQPTANLPSFRVEETVPFTYVGIDYAGPLLVKEEQKFVKCYILVFSCGTLRAVHLELTRSISTEETLLAIKRFISRRGVPSKIFSDNAKSFKKAASVLTENKCVREFFANLQVKWCFIPKKAPWWGGIWERMVRSVKEPLRKVLGRARVSVWELLTLLTEVKAIINSRPLSLVDDNIDNLRPITPAELVMGRPLQMVPGVDERKKEVPMKEQYQLRWRQFQHLLKRWKHQYLLQLRSTIQRDVTKESSWVKSQMVIVIEDNIRPQEWVLGKIEKVTLRRDGLVRSCRVRLAKGKVITRPTKLLIPLFD